MKVLDLAVEGNVGDKQKNWIFSISKSPDPILQLVSHEREPGEDRAGQAVWKRQICLGSTSIAMTTMPQINQREEGVLIFSFLSRINLRNGTWSEEKKQNLHKVEC